MNEAKRDAWEALRAAVEEFPELRLCQLIVNVVGPDPFYLTDERFAAELLAYTKAHGGRSRKAAR
jgi:hypothetical protein